MFWDDYKLTIEKYELKQKRYFCGKELLKFPHTKSIIYKVLLIDYSEMCCANIYSDAEIEVLFKDTSYIPNHHRKGGQSAARFGRCRQNEIVQWFKSIDENLKKVEGEIYVGMSSIYYNQFLSYLSTYNRAKIKERVTCEYSGLSGIYQMINILEKHKGKPILKSKI